MHLPVAGPQPYAARPASAVAGAVPLRRPALLQATGSGAATATAKVAAIRFADSAPSWEELQAMVEAKQKELDAVPQPLETVRRAAAAAAARAGRAGVRGRRRALASCRVAREPAGHARMAARRSACFPSQGCCRRRTVQPPHACRPAHTRAGPRELLRASAHVWAGGGAAGEAVPRPRGLVPLLS